MPTDADLEVEGTDTEDIEPTASGATGELTLTPPAGAEFELEEVKTKRGTVSLGSVPILVWKDLQKAVDFYGHDSICDVLDGTSLRVSFQNIARRYAAAGKSMDEIAQAELNFRPGKRAVGASTPVSRAGNAARRAAEKMGDKAESITRLLERIANGEVSEDELNRLNGEG